MSFIFRHFSRFFSPPMSIKKDVSDMDEPLDPVSVVYPKFYIDFASTRIGKLFVSLDPAIVKIHRYLKMYRITLHKGIDLSNYKLKDIVISSSIIIFLFLYQLRYLVLMFNPPNTKISLAMGDFLSLLDDARNGLFLGLWAALIQAVVNRAFILFYGTRKTLSILTDCHKPSTYIYQCSSIDQLNEPLIKLEQRLLILFEFCRFTTEGIAWAFILFQAFMVLFTASKLNDPIDQLTCLAWSITLIPHTFFTSSGVLVALTSSISGVFYTHYKLDILMKQMENFRRMSHLPPGQVNRMQNQIVNRIFQIVKMTRILLLTMNRQSKILSWLLLIYFYFFSIIASSFSYISLYLDLEAEWLRWVMFGPMIQVWFLVILVPLPIAYVATRTKVIYHQLCSIQTRMLLPIECKMYIQRLINITGNDRHPLTYYTANNIPFTLGYHGLFILNIFLTIFLMIDFLEK